MKVICSGCNSKLNATEKLYGKTVKCPKCATPVSVPFPEPTAVMQPDQIIPTRQEPFRQQAPIQQDYPPQIPTNYQNNPFATQSPQPHYTQVHVNIPTRNSNSLGIASVILGILAFLICWIPFIGMIGIPLSLLGLILGGIGLLLAMTRKGYGIGFAIAGSSICFLAFVIALSISMAMASALKDVNNKITNDLKKSNSTNQTVVTANKKKVENEPLAIVPMADQPVKNKPDAKPKDEWIDAKNAVMQGNVQVRVTNVVIGKVPLKGITDEGQSEDVLLQITVNVTNLSKSKKIDYHGWAGRQFSIGRDSANIKDNFDNSYKRINFGFANKVKGQIESESIYPSKSISDVLVFETPIDTVEFLLLELPAKNFDGEGNLRIRIPKSMITNQ